MKNTLNMKNALMKNYCFAEYEIGKLKYGFVLNLCAFFTQVMSFVSVKVKTSHFWMFFNVIAVKTI